MTNEYQIKTNTLDSKRHWRTFVFFFSSEHISLLMHAEVCWSKCECPLKKKKKTYVFIPLHVYISFLLKPVCMTAVPLDHLCTLCMSFFSSEEKLPGLTDSKEVGLELCRNAALCIVCKNKPSGQRYLTRIYIKQLQKQASVSGVVMQQDHTTSRNLIIFQDKEIKKLEEF